MLDINYKSFKVGIGVAEGGRGLGGGGAGVDFKIALIQAVVRMSKI